MVNVRSLSLAGLALLVSTSLSSAASIKRATLEARAISPMTLQWSPQGYFMFLTGLELVPEGLRHGLIANGLGGPGKLLYENFQQWLFDHQELALWGNLNQAISGGVFGVGTGNVQNTWGWGIIMAQPLNAASTARLVQLVGWWSGGAVQVIPRSNNFFNPVDIGADHKRDLTLSQRSRTDQCPADQGNLLRFATIPVPELDIDRNIRWAGQCPK